VIKKSLSGIHLNFRSANFERVTVIQNAHKSYLWTTITFTWYNYSIKIANVYICGAVAITTVKQPFYLITEHKPILPVIELVNVIAHSHRPNYAFIDFKQMLIIFAAWNHSLFSLSKRNELKLNSRSMVIFVLRLVKLLTVLSENNQRFHSAKVKITHCMA